MGAVGTLAAIIAAFALDAAWDHRGNRISERAYLHALKSEVEVTQSALRESRAFLEQRMRYIDHYLRTVALGSLSAVNADTISAMISVLGPPMEFVPQRAALDDILNAGGLDRVRSDSLRRAIAAYDQALDRGAVVQAAGIELWRNQLSPYDVSYANLAMMAPGDGTAVRAARFKPDVSAYHRNRTYANLLFSRYNFEGRTLNAYEDLLQRMDELLLLLRSYTQ